MQTVLHNQLINAISDDYLAKLWDTGKGYNRSTFWDIIFHIFNWHALITNTMVDNDKFLFNHPMDINKHWPYISKARKLPILCGQCPSPSLPQNNGSHDIKHAVAVGLFSQAYKIWKCCPMENALGLPGRCSGPKNSLTIVKCNK